MPVITYLHHTGRAPAIHAGTFTARAEVAAASGFLGTTVSVAACYQRPVFWRSAAWYSVLLESTLRPTSLSSAFMSVMALVHLALAVV